MSEFQFSSSPAGIEETTAVESNQAPVTIRMDVSFDEPTAETSADNAESEIDKVEIDEPIEELVLDFAAVPSIDPSSDGVSVTPAPVISLSSEGLEIGAGLDTSSLDKLRDHFGSNGNIKQHAGKKPKPVRPPKPVVMPIESPKVLAPKGRQVASLLKGMQSTLEKTRQQREMILSTGIEGVDFVNVCMYAKSRIGAAMDLGYHRRFTFNDGTYDLGEWSSVAALVAYFNGGGGSDLEVMRHLPNRELRAMVRARKISYRPGSHMLAADAKWVFLMRNPDLMTELANVPSEALWTCTHTRRVGEGEDSVLQTVETHEAPWWLPAVRAMHLAAKDWLAADEDTRPRVYPSWPESVRQQR